MTARAMRHAGIEAVLVLAAHFGEVVVDVLQDVAQRDALGVPDDADLVHGRDGGRELLLHELEEAFDRGELFVGIAQQVALGPLREVVQLFVEQAHVFLVLAGEDVLYVGEPALQALDALEYEIVHRLAGFPGGASRKGRSGHAGWGPAGRACART